MKTGHLTALIAAWIVLLVAPAHSARAAGVVLDPAALLTADADADLTPATGAGDAKTGTDTGGLAKRSVSAGAAANLAAGGTEPARQASGAAVAAFTLTSGRLELTGKTSASIAPATAFAAAAHAHAVADIDLPFTLSAETAGDLSWSVTIDAPVRTNEKVTVLLDRTGSDAASLLSQRYLESGSGTFPTLLPGTYRLRVVAGAEATNRGIPGEAGFAQFTAALKTSAAGGGNGGSGGALPLPSALGPGGVLLAAVLCGTTLFRRRGA
jgi:hypothetical protein